MRTITIDNNSVPSQHPEMLNPVFLLSALSGKPIPINGDGMKVRDWVHVNDHCRGIEACLNHGRPGQTYNIGGGAELPNMIVIDAICAAVDQAFIDIEGMVKRFPDAPATQGRKTETLKTFVQDRKGHDRRYAIDETKARKELGYSARWDFKEGLKQTIHWYLNNEAWWRPLLAS